MGAGTMTTWLNAPFEMRFRVIEGLTIRFAQSTFAAGRGRPHHTFG